MKDDFKTFCSRICLPEEVRKEICRLYGRLDWESLRTAMNALAGEKAHEGYSALLAQLPEDERHMKMLAVQLECAYECRERYREKQIGNEIYYATMKCFSRFLGEFYQRNGYYAFDRSWWTYRQLNMSIFRLGELEFELGEGKGRKTIDIHIPSDTDMKREKVLAAVKTCGDFCAQHFPEYAEAEFVCQSWLLSPRLVFFLKEDSNILAFQSLFDITDIPEDKGYYEWLFGAEQDAPAETLKEETSLQRGVKKLLLQSVNLGAGYGKLKDDCVDGAFRTRYE